MAKIYNDQCCFKFIVHIVYVFLTTVNRLWVLVVRFWAVFAGQVAWMWDILIGKYSKLSS